MTPLELAELVVKEIVRSKIDDIQTIAEYFVKKLGDMDESEAFKAQTELRNILTKNHKKGEGFCDSLSDAIEAEDEKQGELAAQLEAEAVAAAVATAATATPAAPIGLPSSLGPPETPPDEKKLKKGKNDDEDEPFVLNVSERTPYKPTQEITDKWVIYRDNLDITCLAPLAGGDNSNAVSTLKIWRKTSTKLIHGAEIGALCVDYLDAALKDVSDQALFPHFHTDKEPLPPEPEPPAEAEGTDAS